jgi:hypothetical protein
MYTMSISIIDIVCIASNGDSHSLARGTNEDERIHQIVFVFELIEK